MGARSSSEMRAFLVARYRRQLGCTAVLAFARHRLARVPYIVLHRGASPQRDAVVVMQRRHSFFDASEAAALDRQRRPTPAPLPTPYHILPQDFFAFQGRADWIRR